MSRRPLVTNAREETPRSIDQSGTSGSCDCLNPLVACLFVSPCYRTRTPRSHTPRTSFPPSKHFPTRIRTRVIVAALDRFIAVTTFVTAAVSLYTLYRVCNPTPIESPPICQICALYCMTNHQLHIPHVRIPYEQDFWGEDYTPTWNFDVPGNHSARWSTSRNTSPPSSSPPSAFVTSSSSLTVSQEQPQSAATLSPSTGTTFKLGSYQLHD